MYIIMTYFSQVKAINDPAVDIEYISYLIKFDSTHGKLKWDVTFKDNEITINGNQVTNEKNVLQRIGHLKE